MDLEEFNFLSKYEREEIKKTRNEYRVWHSYEVPIGSTIISNDGLFKVIIKAVTRGCILLNAEYRGRRLFERKFIFDNFLMQSNSSLTFCGIREYDLKIE
jgi:hypothetical protein